MTQGIILHEQSEQSEHIEVKGVKTNINKGVNVESFIAKFSQLFLQTCQLLIRNNIQFEEHLLQI